MEDIKKTISKNLIHYRNQAKLTQYELAQKLNYSDKSISKWERGAGIPDIIILKQLADLYGIKVDNFFDENTTETLTSDTVSTKNDKHLITTLISVGLVWFVATIVYVALLWLKIPRCWLAFITAIPVSMIVLITLTRIWYPLYVVGIFVSLFVWTLALTIYLYTLTTHSYYLFIICVPCQFLIILWFILRYKTKNKKKPQ